MEFAQQVRECIDIIGLSSIIAREARSFFLLENNWSSLEEAERKLRGIAKSVAIRVIEETNNLNECDPKVEGWVDEVKKVFEVGLTEEYEKLERCSFLCNCTPDLPCRYHLGKKIIEKIERINKLVDEEERFTTYGYRPLPEPVEPKPQTKTVGLEPVLRQLHDYLNDENRSIIGVWGQGGVGKTTLLNAFNNDLVSQRGSFHVVIFIDVSNSETLDVVSIQRTIAERLGLLWVDTDERSRAKVLSRALSKKRFVILLDDVVREFELEVVGIPLPNKGSKIVLASRYQDICNQMGASQNLIRMDTLDETASQELFRSNLGTDALNAMGVDRTIKNYVDQITKKCGGLPLALNVIGKSMAALSNQIDWENAVRAISTDLIDIEGVQEKMFTKLKYSYDRLGESEKKCFLYCTLFPEYSSIKKQQLVQYWMAEGLVSLEKPWKGYLIIKKLLSMCLLLSTNSEFKVKLHSVLREFGLWLANNENNFLVRSGKGSENPPPAELLQSPEKISLMDNKIKDISLPTICNNLETLLLQNNPNFYSLGTCFFKFAPNLKVLDLSNTAIEEFPELPEGDTSIPLQHLNLSKTPIRRLPERFWVLKELRHLDLSSTKHLESTSDNCSKLLKLRVLNLFRSHYGIRDESDLNLDSLKELLSLGIAIHAEDVLKKLKKTDPLARFTSQLSLKHCERMKSIHVADFNHMEHLEELHIESCDSLSELVVDETRVSRLKMLTLWKLGSIQSIVVGPLPHHFQKLRELTIHECHKLYNISWVASLDSLEKLVLSNCNGIKHVVVEGRNEISGQKSGQKGKSFQGLKRKEISTGEKTALEGEASQELVNGNNKYICENGENNKEFPKLRSIVLTQLVNLESICKARVFPCLESIRVQNCPNLRTLPIESADNILKLRQIGGSSEWWDELKWDVNGMRKHLDDLFIPYVTGS
jgi:disease resistance protein RPS2